MFCGLLTGDELTVLGKENQTFELIVQGTESGVRNGLISLRDGLADLGVQDETLGSVELAVAEALNNIVEHAFADLRPGTVSIAIQVMGRRLYVTLQDAGHALPEHALPEGTLPSCDVGFEDLPEGGFGWFLIRQMTEDLRYHREKGQNCLDLIFALP